MYVVFCCSFTFSVTSAPVYKSDRAFERHFIFKKVIQSIESNFYINKNISEHDFGHTKILSLYCVYDKKKTTVKKKKVCTYKCKATLLTIRVRRSNMYDSLF